MGVKKTGVSYGYNEAGGELNGEERKMKRRTRAFAFARTAGGMILSGPNDCRGSTKEARILPAFSHSSVTHGQ